MELLSTSHGKGEIDGARALLKREIWNEQIKPNAKRLQCAFDVVTYLKEEATKHHATHPNAWRIVHKYFWEVKRVTNRQNLSCHCPRLKPMNCVETREIMHNEDEEVEFGVNGEGMVDGVVVGDNITLLCQSGGNETF